MPRRLSDLHPQNADDAASLGEEGIILLKEQISKAITLHFLTRLFSQPDKMSDADGTLPRLR